MENLVHTYRSGAKGNFDTVILLNYLFKKISARASSSEVVQRRTRQPGGGGVTSQLANMKQSNHRRSQAPPQSTRV